MPVSRVRIVIDPRGVANIEAKAARETRRVTEDIADDARYRCPMDTGELVDSIETRYPGPLHGQVWVGTDHWAPTEYGSRPHKIRVRKAKVLHNAETGEFFGREVNHPGTPEQPFMRPAAYTKRRLR